MPPKTQQDPALYSVSESTRYLSISPMTLWRLTTSGKLRAVKIGRRTLYQKTDLDAFVASLSEPVVA